MKKHGVNICGESAPFPTWRSNFGLTRIFLFNCSQVREELNHEALQFVKEQRIRCLLAGAWFPHTLSYKEDTGPITKEQLNRTHPTSWRYARLSHNRRFLHYADFEQKTEHGPRLDQLSNKSKNNHSVPCPSILRLK